MFSTDYGLRGMYATPRHPRQFSAIRFFQSYKYKKLSPCQLSVSNDLYVCYLLEGTRGLLHNSDINEQ